MEIGNTPTVVGRGSHADINLEDPSVSTTHAELVRKGGVVRVKDLNATNGTFINSSRINGEADAREGDLITFGQSAFELRNFSLVEPPPEVERTQIVSSSPAPSASPGPSTSPAPVNAQASSTSSPVHSDPTASYNGLSIASMVLGIVSLLIWPLAIVTGILGVIFGAVSLKNCQPRGPQRGRGFAITGLVTSIIALAFWLLIFLFWSNMMYMY